MQLAAPVHILKSRAKELKRNTSVTMVEALDTVAQAEGFSSWSLLQSKAKDILPKKTEDILGYLNPGDLLLIGARPGLGKTKVTLEVLLQAVNEGRSCFFFSLEYNEADVLQKIGSSETGLNIDCSDAISAGYIISKTQGQVTKGSVIGIDYLQLLDQQRIKPAIQQQVEELKKYAKETGCIVIFISQIDRAFEQKDSAEPDLEDIRLPNPLDLRLFNKIMFVRNQQICVVKTKDKK